MENQKSRGGLIATIVILILLLIGACTYIVYDKFVVDHSNPVKEAEEDTVEDTNSIQINDEILINNSKKCVGVYSDYEDVNDEKASKIELKENGEYSLYRFIGYGESGNYIIIDNVLLLSASTHVSPGPTDHFEKSILYISDDCSSISNNYGSNLFDNGFTLVLSK